MRLDIQHSQQPQRMGPGATTKNFEYTAPVAASTEVIFDLNNIANNDDFDGCCRQYRYLQILDVMITQNYINITNEQDSVYVRVAWSENYEQQEDVEKDDASKVLPNIGRARFIFRPPNAQISYFRNSSTITMNPSAIIATEHLVQSDDRYKIPGGVMIYNTTALVRKVRIVLRVRFIGSKVIDKVEEAKRVLRLEGIGNDSVMEKVASFSVNS